MGMRAHLLVETDSGQVVADLDVNDFEITSHRILYRTWEPGAKSQADQHEILLGSDIVLVKLSPTQDRLKREAS